MEKAKIVIGNDHAGTALKKKLIRHFRKKGVSFLNVGTDTEDSTDYPDYIHPLAEAIENGEAELGIAICGSGNGVAMTANKHEKIRAAVCWTEELAALAREHNNANVIAIPARFVSEEAALSMVDIFLNTKFAGGRHARRVDKIAMC